MNDPTETIRRAETAAINSNPGSREDLEATYGEVWNTSELQKEFTVLGFMNPYCIVERKGVKGTVKFQNDPRLYYSWSPE